MSVVAQKSNVVVSEFSNVRLKSFKSFQKEGKNPVYFVELVDADTFESTGEMILLKKDFTQNDALAIAKLEKQPVRATIKVSPYNGRASVACVDISSL